MRSKQGFVFDPDIFYVVDFNAAANMPSIFDPDATLPERNLIISMIYQRHAQKLSDKPTDIGEAVSELSILLERMIETGEKGTIDGARSYKKGNLTVIIDSQNHDHENSNADNIAGETIKDTIALALYWNTKVTETKGRVRVLTNDPKTRIAAQDQPDCVIIKFNPEIYKGWRDVSNIPELCDYWRRDKIMTPDNFRQLTNGIILNPHEYVFFAPAENGANYDYGMIGRFDPDAGKIVPLKYLWNLRYTKPYNRYQAAALENECVCLASIQIGPAGCGKTRIASGAAIELSDFLNPQKFKSMDDSQKGKKSKSKGDRNDNRDKNDAKIMAAITAQFDADGEFCGVDIHGNERKPKLRPKEQQTFYAKECQVPEDSQEVPMFKGIILIPPRNMMGEHLIVPGDNRKKYEGMLGQYVDTAASILEARSDKRPGGFPLSDEDIVARAKAAVARMDILPPTEMNGRTLRGVWALDDETEFSTCADLTAALGRIDIGSHISFMGDPTQTNNRYGYIGNPIVRFCCQHASNPYVGIVWYPFDENYIVRPGGRAAMWGMHKLINL